MLFCSLKKKEPRISQFTHLPIGLELRISSPPDFAFIEFAKKSSLPWILTVRKSDRGIEEGHQIELLDCLLQENPTYCDLEATLPKSTINSLQKKYPNIKWIISHHEEVRTKASFEDLYRLLLQHDASFYKLALYPTSTQEALQFLLFAKGKKNLTPICLGKEYSFTRLLHPILGHDLSYAPLSKEEATAPGQIPLEELEKNRFFTFSKQTTLYALLGDPIDHSLSPTFHNEMFKKGGKDSLYIKLKCSEEEFTSIFPLAQLLGCQGFSFTTPLKEIAFKTVASKAAQEAPIEAINTWVHGSTFNTDGIGTCDAIEKRVPIQSKTVLLLGAGATARAIAHEAKKRGGHVIVSNRTESKGLSVANQLGVSSTPMHTLPSHYDIIIQATPSPDPIPHHSILKEAVAVDVNYREGSCTPFLKRAEDSGAITISGVSVFEKQAERQSALFFTPLGARKETTSQPETARKLPQINDRKPVHISNMNRLAIVDPRGFGSVSGAEVVSLRALIPKGDPVILISDKTVFDLYGKPFVDLYNAIPILVPKGESAKTREIKALIEDLLFSLHCGKKTVLIALGGGSILDLAGFIAATYLRGISFVAIPTTLLAIVDASIGGKNGINTPFGKNLLGSFLIPTVTHFDATMLETLGEKEIFSGVVEIVKLGLIYQKELLEKPLKEAIFLAIETKKEITQKDPKDQGIRNLLNFGHTIGHALETISSFSLSHGEAVAVGLLVESHLSFLLGHLSKNSYEFILSLYHQKGATKLKNFLSQTPLSLFQRQSSCIKLPQEYERSLFLKILGFDKKGNGKIARFALPKEIGSPLIFEHNHTLSPPESTLNQALCWMEETFLF